MNGMTMKQFITNAIEAELLKSKPYEVKRHRIQLPLLRSKHPGTLNLTNNQIEESLA